MASLSPSWSLCPCYCSHTVPTKATLSSPQPPQPHCPHAVPLCRPVPTTAIQAPRKPPHPHLSHHSHTVPTQPCVCLSPWPLCPYNSHPILILCGTVTTVILSSPQPPCVTLWGTPQLSPSLTSANRATPSPCPPATTATLSLPQSLPPWSPCPLHSHSILMLAIRATLCLCSPCVPLPPQLPCPHTAAVPLPSQPPCPHTATVSPCYRGHPVPTTDILSPP